MQEFLNTTFFRNILGVVVIFFIWLIFSIVGLKGIKANRTIKQIRQEAGISLLTLSLFTISIFGLVALFFSTKTGNPTPIPS